MGQVGTSGAAFLNWITQTGAHPRLIRKLMEATVGNSLLFSH